MDAKTLEYMGTRVDRCRAIRQQIEKLQEARGNAVVCDDLRVVRRYGCSGEQILMGHSKTGIDGAETNRLLNGAVVAAIDAKIASLEEEFAQL